jgi:ActR/RegA family two-component response regulator
MIGSPIALVVDADLIELRRTEQALKKAGFLTISATSFANAKVMLDAMTPEIVIADIKLEAFNGLHLAALCALSRPAMPFVATHSNFDVVLEADAKQLGAAYVVKTPTREEVARTALQMFESQRHGVDSVRRFHRKTAPVPTVARVATSDAEVVDISYGGLQLKLPSVARRVPLEVPPEVFDVVFPQLDLSLRASRVWISPNTGAGGWLCGADISHNESQELERWREFVDSVG